LSTELTPLSFGYVVLVAFWTVLVAELVGDKSIYTIASLALRYRARVVITAITAAFACKMLAAVLLAGLLAHLQSRWTDILSACAFFVSAFFLWFKEPEPVPKVRAVNPGWWRAAMVCFASIFLTEWGDPSQIAVAALTVKFHSSLATWLGGTLAMTAKGSLAIALGIRLSDRLPQTMLRTLATASCCILGILALSGIVFR
jgi:putative Ca2+/H+ antiporter (TMEM165/GDT1 family)